MFYKTDYTLMNNKGKRKSLGAVAQPKFISPLSLGYALHTLEEGDFFRKCVKQQNDSNDGEPLLPL
ncbi:hypothetical protein DEJ61_17735 [Bacilli bacterium]|nr:hypothetical protein DEJ60_17775 [Bacilli bacterium]RCT50172.1 hypothetical protein DEJ61_17735 [Bacilli bacterium]